MSKQTGKVKWFNDRKGYGFITPDNGDQDIFAHFKDIKVEGFKTLKEGTRVTYEKEVGPKGEKANNITPQN